jgi:hypothetical protein
LLCWLIIGLVVTAAPFIVPFALLAGVALTGGAPSIGAPLAGLEENDLGCSDVGTAQPLTVGEDGQLYYWTAPVPGVLCPIGTETGQ